MAEAHWIGTNGRWLDGANWSGGAVPSGFDDATIDTAQRHSIVLDGDTSLGSLVLGNDQLTVRGNLLLDNEGGPKNVVFSRQPVPPPIGHV